jgi:hypothetical protein
MVIYQAKNLIVVLTVVGGGIGRDDFGGKISIAWDFGAFNIFLVFWVAQSAALVVHPLGLEPRKNIKEVVFILCCWNLGRSLGHNIIKKSCNACKGLLHT